ncbi:PilZ domain-containing protein [Methylomagnum ishizawai]|uniref:PilZ domain-containing protein n=1 Tax=Methylomagnum ishizawai TaxID=1760988 RepID=A0A1Y6D0C5_9GAMM|nr:PilZ domain-containing protein [Methylomagnum ishizawai]SMF93854.1 PilZ domain-containing protein [Methylomagnum ishizawai]
MDRRKNPRKMVTHPLEVRDLNRGVALGHLADIGLDGLMLLCPEVVPASRVYALALDLPGELGQGAQAEFGAESLWTETSLEPGRYWVGFHIIDISPANQERLRQLVALF